MKLTLFLSRPDLALRPLERRDISRIAEFGNNRGIWLNNPDTFPFPYTEADAAEWLGMPEMKSNWAITLHDEFIGNIGIDEIGVSNRGAGQIVYWLEQGFAADDGKGRLPA